MQRTIVIVDNDLRLEFLAETWLYLNDRKLAQSVRFIQLRSFEDLREWLLHNSPPDIIISDVLLSRQSGKNGPDIYWFIVNAFPGIPVYLVTAWFDRATRQATGLDQLPSPDDDPPGPSILSTSNDDWFERIADRLRQPHD